MNRRKTDRYYSQKLHQVPSLTASVCLVCQKCVQYYLLVTNILCFWLLQPSQLCRQICCGTIFINDVRWCFIFFLLRVHTLILIVYCQSSFIHHGQTSWMKNIVIESGSIQVIASSHQLDLFKCRDLMGDLKINSQKLFLRDTSGLDMTCRLLKLMQKLKL